MHFSTWMRSASCELWNGRAHDRAVLSVPPSQAKPKRPYIANTVAFWPPLEILSRLTLGEVFQLDFFISWFRLSAPRDESTKAIALSFVKPLRYSAYYVSWQGGMMARTRDLWDSRIRSYINQISSREINREINSWHGKRIIFFKLMVLIVLWM